MVGKITLLSERSKKKVLLFKNLLTIGRNPDNDLQLSYPSISRNHAKISCKNKQFCIQDCKSNNGTFVNGKIITGVSLLKNGDTIRISSIEMEFEILPEGNIDKKALNQIFKDYAGSPRSTVTGFMNMKDLNLQSLYKKIKLSKNI